MHSNQVEKSAIFAIDRNSKLPLYDLVEQNLRGLIIEEALKPGEGIPSELELAELYGVSRLTVRRAIDELARQNWLNKRHGVGTFVTRPNIAKIAPSKLSFTEQMLSIGRMPTSRMINFEVIPSDSQIAHTLGLYEGEDVIHIVRVRLADEVPVLLETAFLSHKRFPDLEQLTLNDGSLYRILGEKYGVNIIRMDQTLKPVTLTKEQAKLLDDIPGAPSIYSEIIAFSGAGEPVEYSWSVANGSHSAFYFSFNRENL